MCSGGTRLDVLGPLYNFRRRSHIYLEVRLAIWLYSDPSYNLVLRFQQAKHIANEVHFSLHALFWHFHSNVRITPAISHFTTSFLSRPFFLAVLKLLHACFHYLMIIASCGIYANLL